MKWKFDGLFWKNQSNFEFSTVVVYFTFTPHFNPLAPASLLPVLWLRRGRRQNRIDKCFVLLLDAMAEGRLKRRLLQTIPLRSDHWNRFWFILNYHSTTLRLSGPRFIFYPLSKPPVSVHLSVCVSLFLHCGCVFEDGSFLSVRVFVFHSYVWARFFVVHTFMWMARVFLPSPPFLSLSLFSLIRAARVILEGYSHSNALNSLRLWWASECISPLPLVLDHFQSIKSLFRYSQPIGFFLLVVFCCWNFTGCVDVDRIDWPRVRVDFSSLNFWEGNWLVSFSKLVFWIQILELQSRRGFEGPASLIMEKRDPGVKGHDCS